MSAVLDFPIQEAQTILAESQKLEDDIAMDISLAYFPDVKRVWGGFEFTASKTFDKGDWHNVVYALPGADANGLVIRAGQLVGTGLLSKYTARTEARAPPTCGGVDGLEDGGGFMVTGLFLFSPTATAPIPAAPSA